MPNVRLYFATIAALLLAGYLWGLWQYQTGWREGRNDLIAEQTADTEKLRQENAQRQQVEDAKATEAEQQGEAKTVTITRDVVRYVQVPNRVKCAFPPERVQLKARAAANANFIPGFDDAPVPDAAAGE
jgi:hypothetical protein